MSRFIRNLVLSLTLLVTVGTAGVASASHVNDSVKRHQQPNIGFWQHSKTHHVRVQSQPVLSGLFR